jgi:hypothetical protein
MGYLVFQAPRGIRAVSAWFVLGAFGTSAWIGYQALKEISTVPCKLSQHSQSPQRALDRFNGVIKRLDDLEASQQFLAGLGFAACVVLSVVLVLGLWPTLGVVGVVAAVVFWPSERRERFTVALRNAWKRAVHTAACIRRLLALLGTEEISPSDLEAGHLHAD